AAHGGQILCSERAATALMPDLERGVALLDLGSYRLRGVPRPEHLYQVEYSEMPRRQFPPLSAALAHVPNLPAAFTRFFGREPELAQLVELLGPAAGGGVEEWKTGRVEGSGGPAPPFLHSSSLPVSARLVTLTGHGGTGKTRLAVEVAGRLVGAYHGAVWFVPLAEVRDSRLVMH